MANRQYQQFQGTLKKGIVPLYPVVAVGASGAVTLKKWNPTTKAYDNASTTGVGYQKGTDGVSSVSRTGAGLWSIVLQDNYFRVIGVRATTFNSTGAVGAQMIGIDTDSDVASASAPTLKINIQSSAGTSADPTSGDRMHLE